MELQAHLLREDPLYTRTGRQQSLNLEFLMEKEYLAVSCLASVHAQMLLSLPCFGKGLRQYSQGPCSLGHQPRCHLKVFLVEVEFDLPGVQAGVLVTRLLQALCQGLWPTEEHTNH